MFCRRLNTVIASTAALSAMIGCASFVGAQGRPHGRPHFPGSQQPGGGPGEQQGGPGQNGQQNEPTSPGIPSPTLSQNTFVDDFGQFTTINNSAEAIQSNPFFEALGTNQRSCVTCHRPSEGWSIAPASVQNLFAQTDGLDPLFRPVDGANSPDAPVTTLADRQTAYSELLTKGLLRVGLPIPTGAQFTLIQVYDPYGFASAKELSLFRRPLPATNLSFLSTVQYDGRETFTGESINYDLTAQAANAILTHEQGAVTPSNDQLQQIVNFESANFTAQSFDNRAGPLNSDGGLGGPSVLSNQPFTQGINDPVTASFDRSAFSLYDSWPASPGDPLPGGDESKAEIARGERIFNNRPFEITNVPGVNDIIGSPTIIGTCTTCHNTPNVGDHSLPIYVDLGLTDPQRTTPDLPLYTLKNNATGQIRITSDPGRALVTGRWRDIGKFKVPSLRGFASRAPYFHNGSAPDVQSVIRFYDRRFRIGLAPQDRRALAAFLNSL